MRMLRKCTRILGGALILSMTLSAQTVTTLFNFGPPGSGSPWNKGPLSEGPVTVGLQGELYGVTQNGGKWGRGTVYELLPPASSGEAWTAKVLHSFSGEDGLNPVFGLVLGPMGSLYGVAYAPNGSFEAFELYPPTGTGSDWLCKVVYEFTSADSEPAGGLALGSPLGYGQSLYGLTRTGIVYRLTPPATAGGAWTRTTLYTFAGGSAGSTPLATLAVGSAGTLFGVTSDGGWIGETPCATGCGTVFSLTPALPGGAWTHQILHAFQPLMGDGYNPQAGVIIGPGGVMYGTTMFGGGSNAAGTAFSLTAPAVPGTPMTETILYAFTSTVVYPDTSLVPGPNGMLYGVALQDYEQVFELSPPALPGGGWTLSTVYSGNESGGAPSNVALGPDGTLYVTTLDGGAYGYGAVLAVTP